MNSKIDYLQHGGLRCWEHGEGKVCIPDKWPIRSELIPVSVKSSYNVGAFLSPSPTPTLDGILVYHMQGCAHSIKVASTHLYTWVERGNMREKCLAQEHNIIYNVPCKHSNLDCSTRAEVMSMVAVSLIFAPLQYSSLVFSTYLV